MLLFFIYIAFIGLGLPDSLFGTAWPAIYADLNLPFSYGSFVTTLVFFGTMMSSMLSAKLISLFGTGRVAAVSTLMTAAQIILFYYMGVAIGRFLAGICSEWINVYKIISIGMFVTVIGCLLLFVSEGFALIIVGLMLIGVGNGPMFPNFNYITPLLYGEEKSPALIGSEYTSASIATMTVPIIVYICLYKQMVSHYETNKKMTEWMFHKL